MQIILEIKVGRTMIRTSTLQHWNENCKKKVQISTSFSSLFSNSAYRPSLTGHRTDTVIESLSKALIRSFLNGVPITP